MSLICGDDSPSVLFPGAIPADACDALLAEIEALPLVEGEVVNPVEEGDWRRSRIAFLPPDHWIGEALRQAAGVANEAGNWNYDLTRVESVQASVYGEGGHYGWHADAHAHEDGVRKLSVVLQLDDGGSYEGGDLRFRRFGAYDEDEMEPMAPEMRQRGSIVVFPSYQVHRVTPVTAGVRRSISLWLVGPRFR